MTEDELTQAIKDFLRNNATWWDDLGIQPLHSRRPLRPDVLELEGTYDVRALAKIIRGAFVP